MPGQPLDKETRAFMEPHFGHDFSEVRVHTDGSAAESAEAMNALAYTVGSEIAFGAGRFAPKSLAGRRLLAHELAHVVQQRAGIHLQDGFGREGDVYEMQANAVASLLPGTSMPPGSGFPGSRGFDGTLKQTAKGVPLVHRKIQFQKDVGLDPTSNPALGAKLRAEQSAKVPLPCPKTHTIPDNVYTSIGKAWARSGHGGEKVVEHGGRIVTDKSGTKAIRTGTGGSGSIDYPQEPGDVTEGTFHTHPYSEAEGSTMGVSFSGADIENFVNGAQGDVKYVGAGSCNFALVTLDQAKRDTCKNKNLGKRWNETFAQAGGTFQGQVETAATSAIAGCGLCYYKACRPNDKSPVPKTLNLT